jgi:arginine decarboxylase-like protein
MVSFARYEKEFLQDGFRNWRNRQIKKGKLTEEQATGLADDYESHYHGYTYLTGNGHR